MAEEQLRSVIDGYSGQAAGRARAQLGSLARATSRPLQETRQRAEADAEQRWAAKLDDVHAQWGSRLESEVAAARAEVERALDEAVTRARGGGRTGRGAGGRAGARELEKRWPPSAPERRRISNARRPNASARRRIFSARRPTSNARTRIGNGRRPIAGRRTTICERAHTGARSRPRKNCSASQADRERTHQDLQRALTDHQRAQDELQRAQGDRERAHEDLQRAQGERERAQQDLQRAHEALERAQAGTAARAGGRRGDSRAGGPAIWSRHASATRSNAHRRPMHSRDARHGGRSIPRDASELLDLAPRDRRRDVADRSARGRRARRGARVSPRRALRRQWRGSRRSGRLTACLRCDAGPIRADGREAGFLADVVAHAARRCRSTARMARPRRCLPGFARAARDRGAVCARWTPGRGAVCRRRIRMVSRSRRGSKRCRSSAVTRRPS